MATQVLNTLRRLWTLTVGLPILLGHADAFLFAAEAAVATTSGGKAKISREKVYSCDFNTQLSKRWRMVGGKWELQDGYLRQLAPQPEDPTKAIIVLGDNSDDVSHDVLVTAKLHLDTWQAGNWARAGISICSDPTTGHGLNLVFHNGRLEFVHDYVAWGPGVDFPCRAGESYWMNLCKKAGELKGKAWRDQDPEPADWMVIWKHSDQTITG